MKGLAESVAFRCFLRSRLNFLRLAHFYCRGFNIGYWIYRWDHRFSLLRRWDDHHVVSSYNELGVGPLIISREAQIVGPFHRPSLGDIDAARRDLSCRLLAD